MEIAYLTVLVREELAQFAPAMARFAAARGNLSVCVLDAAGTALAVKQSDYAVAQLKQEQGSISQNELLEARDAVDEAREAADTAANDLFSAYRTYRWAVDRGILNY